MGRKTIHPAKKPLLKYSYDHRLFPCPIKNELRGISETLKGSFPQASPTSISWAVDPFCLCQPVGLEMPPPLPSRWRAQTIPGCFPPTLQILRHPCLPSAPYSSLTTCLSAGRGGEARWRLSPTTSKAGRGTKWAQEGSRCETLLLVRRSPCVRWWFACDGRHRPPSGALPPAITGRGACEGAAAGGAGAAGRLCARR